MKDQYETELAGTIVSLFNSGNPDPSIEEIAEAHFPQKFLGNEIASGIGKRLMKVGKILEDLYETPVCLVNRRYYTLYRHSAPTNEAEAKSCVPGGAGNQSAGIRKLNGDDDLIWQATIRRDGLSAAGKEKRLADRVLNALEQEEVSSENALRLLTDVKKASAPERQELLQQLLDALEPGNQQPELEAGDEVDGEVVEDDDQEEGPVAS